MKVIINSIIPFKGYKVINLFGVLFVRKGSVISCSDLNHEAIHSREMRELLWLPFYLWYGIEWVIRLFQYGNAYKAYRNISFEREAYDYENYDNYLQVRKPYNFIKYLKNQDYA